MCRFLIGFPHCSCQLCSPWASRTSLYTPDKSTQAEKKYQGTKALYVMLSSCIDFFFLRIFDRQHKIVASCHVKLGLGDRIGFAALLNSLVEMCLGWGIVKRCWLWVIHLCELPAFTQRHIYKLQKVNHTSELLLCHYVSLNLNRIHTLCSPTTKQRGVQYKHARHGPVSSVGRRMDGFKDCGAGMGCWFVSAFLWRISSCVIRPGSDPTCPDVPPHPPSCPCVTHSLMNRWSHATSEPAWLAGWFSEDMSQPPLL